MGGSGFGCETWLTSLGFDLKYTPVYRMTNSSLKVLFHHDIVAVAIVEFIDGDPAIGSDEGHYFGKVLGLIYNADALKDLDH